MRRFAALLVLLLASWAWAAPASASADLGCSPAWKLFHAELSECDNIAMLAPGNDTRVNLVLLLIDREGGRRVARPAEPLEALFYWRAMRDQLYPAPEGDISRYAEGEGSRCRSDASGAAAFNEAIGAARKLSAEERAILTAARNALRPDCAGSSGGADAIAQAAARMKSPSGKGFGRYLQGALAFYDGAYDAASAHFAALRATSDPWLKETARYMLGRVEVNRAQRDAFDEYGFYDGPEKIDQQAVDAAEAALLSYLRDYPRGRYSVSARGLLRRVYWLGGRTAKLAAQYAALFALPPTERGIDDGALAEEIDLKLLPSLKATDTSDPTLLAMVNLKRMRSCREGGTCTPMPRGELEAQRGYFAGDPSLFAYLLAVHAFYVSNSPTEALRFISDTGSHDGYLGFSQAVLRQMAVERLARPNASEQWLILLPSAKLPYQRALLELAIAYSYERNRMAGRIFAVSSPVRAPVLRETILIYVADAALLRARARDANAQPHERELALFILLYKELTRSAYRDFLTDLALVPPDAPTQGNTWNPAEGETIPLGIFNQHQDSEGFGCPPIKAIAATLAANPRDVRGRLCLAEFVRTNGFDYTSIDSPPADDQLGGTPSLFPGAPFSRLEIYKAVIADPRSTAPNKAYALYRAVRCYAPVGHNSCGGEDVPLAQRRAWFQRLKADFPDSPWAQDLKYYW